MVVSVLFDHLYSLIIKFARLLSINYWFFRWTIPLFKTGYTKILGIEDLYNPLKKDKSSVLGNRLEALVLFSETMTIRNTI